MSEYAFTEAEVLSSLDPAVRRQFMALQPAERRFLLTASSKEKAIYEALGPLDQTAYAVLPAHLREECSKLRPPDRVCFVRLSPTQQFSFLGSSAERRQVVRHHCPPPAPPVPVTRFAPPPRRKERAPTPLEVVAGFFRELIPA